MSNLNLGGPDHVVSQQRAGQLSNPASDFAAPPQRPLLRAAHTTNDLHEPVSNEDVHWPPDFPYVRLQPYV